MVLKILLWIILGILGLILLLVLLVLFAPIKYKVDAEYHGTAKVYARIKFLIVSVRFRFNQENKALEQDIRIAGIRHRTDKSAKENKQKKSGKKSREKAEDKSENESENEIDFADEINSGMLDSDVGETDTVTKSMSTQKIPDVLDSQDEVQKADMSEISEESYSSQDATHDFADEGNNESEDLNDDSFVHEEFDLWDNEVEELPKSERSVFGRIKAFFAGLAAKVKKLINWLKNFSPDKIAEKIDSKTADIRRKINRLKKFWNMSCTVKTRAYLKKYIVGLLKHIGPRKIKGHVRYGFDEPYKTGQITGYLSLLPFVYQKGFTLEPDFYNKVIDGNISLKGRIRIGYIIRIALNINLWRTIKLATKVMK